MDLSSPSLAKQTHGGNKAKEAQMSARRLAATLWEINGLPSPSGGGEEEENFEGKKNGAELGNTHLLDQSHNPVCKNKDGSKPAGNRRKSSAFSQKLQLTEYIGGGRTDCVTNGAIVEVASQSAVENAATIKTRLKQLSSSLAASKEIVRVLFRLWGQEEQNSTRQNLVSALRVEIDQARHQVDRLIHEQGCNQKDVETLLKQFAAEKAAWKSREQERLREIEIERKLRIQSERLSKRLGRELADAKAHLSKAVKEVERERQMLQLEKNAALERLRSELEAYLEGKESNGNCGGNDDHGDIHSSFDRNRDFGGFLQTLHCEGEKDSGDDELHSIELNVDGLRRGYKWSFVNDDDSRRVSVDEVFKGRRSLSEKIQWENICLQRTTSDGIEWDFTTNNSRKQGNGNRFDKGKLSEDSFRDEKDDQIPIKGKSSANSRPESPTGEVPLGNSKRFSVDSKALEEK